MLVVINYIHVFPILIGVILGLKFYSRGWPLISKLLTILILTALITEVTAFGWSYYHLKNGGTPQQINNSWIYTLALIPYYLIFFAIYYNAVNRNSFKKTILYSGIAFLLFALINMFFIQKLGKVNSYTHLMADLIVFMCIYFYFEELRLAKEVKKLYSNPMIWISAGSFFFHLLNIPFLFLLNYLNSYYMPIAKSFVYMYIFFIFINYTFYIKALLCPAPQK
jgi:hypothetical protein